MKNILKIITLGFGFFLFNLCFAQEAEEKNEKIFEVVETMPEYPGGQAEMIKFIANNFVYPKKAKKKNIEGRVLLTFVIDEEGNVTNVRPWLPKEKQLGYGLEKEAVRVIKLMPNWIPGQQRGKNVKVRFTMPIMCRLD